MFITLLYDNYKNNNNYSISVFYFDKFSINFLKTFKRNLIVEILFWIEKIFINYSTVLKYFSITFSLHLLRLFIIAWKIIIEGAKN